MDYKEPEPKDMRGFALEGDEEPIKGVSENAQGYRYF